ncbi:MAG: SGNH/GDSL hydrolase family protein [Ruminococcaceae bacterium]|nr:SGNH/GDSL hydrolase family protein [Oscillospiraceae bacterium]
MEKSYFKGKKFVFLGDSITYGQVGPSCPENIYHQYLKRNFELGEAVNYGINGSRIAHQELEQNGGAFSVRYTSMDNDADFAVVFGGINDFLHGTADFGEFDDRTVNTFYGACHVLLSGLVKKYIGKTVIVMTPPHCEREKDPIHRRNAVTGKTLSEYVDALISVARYYSVPVLDIYATSGIVPHVEENKIKFAPDGLHPNDPGHQKIAERLESFLLSL